MKDYFQNALEVTDQLKDLGKVIPNYDTVASLIWDVSESYDLLITPL